MGSTAVKVYGEATLIFPIIVAQTFAKKYHQEKQKQQRQEKEQNNKY
jgi:deoxyhypusine synthase